MKKFDIMCTATLRPELLKRTFDSHIKHLFQDHIRKARLIINIDKIGAEDEDKALTEIFRYLGGISFGEIQVNVSDKPHFSKAFIWCLGQLQNHLVFNLEEDWELTKDLDFQKMVFLFNDRDLVHLRLSQFHSFKEKGVHRMKNWNKFIEWNGDYFEVPKALRGTIGWAGHPSLNRTSFMMGWATVLDPEKNPEKQIKGHRPILLNNRFGVFHTLETEPVLKDIGRAWMNKHGFQKKGTKAFFTEWEKI